MIRLIEAQRFRCLKYVHQPLGPFHVLVGPNASGKTTFLDVVSFLGSLVSRGLEAAVGERTANFADLTWGRAGGSFELAIEAAVPEDRQRQLPDAYDTVRYEVCLATDETTDEVVIRWERVALKNWSESPSPERTLFPMLVTSPDTIATPKGQLGKRTVVSKAAGGNDTFQSEVTEKSGKGWVPSFKLGPRRSALANLPEDETRFPVSTWLKGLLSSGVQSLILNSLLIRKASPPGQVRGFKPDGSNLPWVIEELVKHPDRFRGWLAHLQTALPDLEGIRTIERPDDKHRYLMIRYRGGLEVPSWMASDGTLRLLALTIPAYLPNFQGIYLIEEPENGIHPRAVATVYQSLSSAYGAQILLATHSPVILSIVEPQELLCFQKTEEGATDIVRGSEHPRLRDWRHETSLDTLFVAGVLG